MAGLVAMLAIMIGREVPWDVKAHKFILLGDNGKEAACLAANTKGSGVGVFDENGKCRVSLVAYKDCSGPARTLRSLGRIGRLAPSRVMW